MKDTKTVLFGFATRDYRTVQLWLEELDREGWAMETVKGLQFPRAKLRRRSGPSVRYCVDVADHPLKSYEQRDAYLALCADAGWELVVSFRGLNLFRAQPGRDPVPIQTDPELERRRLWRQVVLPDLVVSALVLLLALLVWSAALQPLHLFYFLLSYPLLLTCLVLPPSLAALLWDIWSNLIFALRLRAGTLPPPDPRRAKRRSVGAAVSTAITLCVFTLLWGVNLHATLTTPNGSPILTQPPVLTWADLGRADGSCWGTTGGTLLLTYIRSSQHPATDTLTADTPALLVEEYRAAYPWVADLVSAGLRREVPADAPGLAVLRVGDTVLRLEGPADFLDPELQGVIAANLAGR